MQKNAATNVAAFFGGHEGDRTLDLTDANGLGKLFLELFDAFYTYRVPI